jgi:tripartite-type tricarboxylate transporter receptor subunit TctC
MLLMEKFKKETGADLVRVPFRGGSEVVTAVLSGTTPVAFSGLGTLGTYIRAGKMTGLAVDSPTRSALFPEIQTLTELGYPSKLSSVYFGLVAPSGTPKAIISKLRDEIVNIANEPGFRRKHLIERGLEPILNTPEEFGQLLKQDRASFERVVMDAGLQPQ